jgi:hypothetical protein
MILKTRTGHFKKLFSVDDKKQKRSLEPLIGGLPKMDSPGGLFTG